MWPVCRFSGQAQQPSDSRYLLFLWQLGRRCACRPVIVIAQISKYIPPVLAIRVLYHSIPSFFTLFFPSPSSLLSILFSPVDLLQHMTWRRTWTPDRPTHQARARRLSPPLEVAVVNNCALKWRSNLKCWFCAGHRWHNSRRRMCNRVTAK